MDIMKRTQVDLSIVQIYVNSPEKVRLLNDWGQRLPREKDQLSSPS
ncbi:MAG: hypothetical protein H3Z53_05780 [archaeon]|nr:hypothetical protein [archaeon]MCP8318067.1 hypothetical protein [archaeon]